MKQMQIFGFCFAHVFSQTITVLCLCAYPLESPVLKWLCFMWCGAATLVLLTLPKLIIDNSTTLDTQVGRFCVYAEHISQYPEIKCSVFSLLIGGCDCTCVGPTSCSLHLSPFLLQKSPATSKSVEITGYICGYLASVFYLSSRFPQLYKNVSDHFWPD